MVCGWVDAIVKKLAKSVHFHEVNVHISIAYHLVNLKILLIVLNGTVLLVWAECPARFM